MGDKVNFESIDLSLNVSEIYDRVDNEDMQTFIKDKEISNKLSGDVSEMEKMLNEYLHFASNRSTETTKNIRYRRAYFKYSK